VEDLHIEHADIITGHLIMKARQDKGWGQKDWSEPSTIYDQFLSSLIGEIDGKMSSSLPASCIFLSDTLGQVKKKIGKSFSGEKATLECAGSWVAVWTWPIICCVSFSTTTSGWRRSAR